MTRAAADHSYDSADWVVRRVWLSCPDTADWLTARFTKRTEVYENYSAVVAATNADLAYYRDLRRIASTADESARVRRLARAIEEETPDVPIVRYGPTAGLLALAGPRVFYGVAGQYLGSTKQRGFPGYLGIYRNGRLVRDPGLLPPDSVEPWPWPARPNA